MALTIEDVRRVALLARLELDDAELARQAGHINELMARFEDMQGADVTGVEPTSHSIPVFNVLRDDDVVASLTQAQVLANAPQARDGCFVVPRILEG